MDSSRTEAGGSALIQLNTTGREQFIGLLGCQSLKIRDPFVAQPSMCTPAPWTGTEEIMFERW